MEIYRQIKKNKRNTFFFFLMFFFLIIAVVYGISNVVSPESTYSYLTLAFILTLGGSFFSYYNSDKMVLKMANARPVSKEKEPYLYHTIEGVAIAAGVPTPKAYVIESEVPNAFATGRNPENAAVAVTRGLMDLMNREELEGVIAHEMAHIKNYDILFSTIVIVLAGTIVYLTSIVRNVLYFGGGRRDNKNSNPILMAIGILSIIFAPIAATLAKMAISRNREYLADATAAEMLGYPEGLASALEKLNTYSNPKKAIKDGFANEATAGLFIINPLHKNLNVKNLLSTHPPLEERVKILRKM